MWVGQWEQRFPDTQMKSLLEGKKTLVRGLKGKKGSYDAYLIPEGIEDYSYIKDGKEIKGSQYKFKMGISTEKKQVKRRQKNEYRNEKDRCLQHRR